MSHKNGNHPNGTCDPKALPGNNRPGSAAEQQNGTSAGAILKTLYKELESWRGVADAVGDVSPALCWKVANGRCESSKIEYALGIRETRVRLAADMSREQREALKAMAEPFGGWSALCRALADGTYIIRKAATRRRRLAAGCGTRGT